jgi:hypothetical protein
MRQPSFTVVPRCSFGLVETAKTVLRYGLQRVSTGCVHISVTCAVRRDCRPVTPEVAGSSPVAPVVSKSLRA